MDRRGKGCTASGVARAGRAFLGLLAIAVVVLPLAGCGGSPGVAKAQRPQLIGHELHDPAPAPRLVLRDADGHRVDLRADRGRAVLVTFLYTHCPDTCPLIAEHLRATLDRLGRRARDVRLVAVSTDPRGDTPATVRRFLAQHGLTGRMAYAIGSRAQLAKVWRAWGIAAAPGTRPGEVEHTALVFGITGGGRLAALYPAQVLPADLAHDVPILAAAR